MTLVRGEHYQSDLALFNACDPVIRKPGRYQRSCQVPQVDRIYLGYGLFNSTQNGLDSLWKRTQWSLWVDGHPVSLLPFGTSTSNRTRPTVFFRNWNVILVGITLGKHTVRYRARIASLGTIDCTWTVRVF